MKWITDEKYAEQMRAEAEPFLEQRREAGFMERAPGEQIYYEHYRADAPRAAVVISHGFTESIAKYAESIYYLLHAGFDVWGLDHRGHGRSCRLNDNPYVVHVEHFEDYVLDLRFLVETRVRPVSEKLPLYLYCHSMGGCIGAWLIESCPELFDKAVLSSPMLGLSFGKLPLPVVSAVMAVKCVGNVGKEALGPVEEFPEERFEDSAATAECRFQYYSSRRKTDSKLQTCSASARWVREAIRACARVCSPRQMAQIRIPVLLLQAGRDAYVKNASQDLFASKVPGCRIVRFPELKHELYMSEQNDLRSYWETVLAFLG